MWSPALGPVWSVKYLNFGQKLPIRRAHHTFLERRPSEITKLCFVPRGELKKGISSWTISFSEMLMFQSKFSSILSTFMIIFLCNTLILLLLSSSSLTLYNTPLSPILETIIWNFASQKSFILPVPSRWVIFLISTRSPGWRLNENLEQLFLCCMSLFFPCFDTNL